MKIEVHVDIKATPNDIWSIISDIENASENISAIEKIEILENSTRKILFL